MSGPVPQVTGISPAEGPPGTEVKIRGANLGKNVKDLIGVFICSVNCTYTSEWQNAHYIKCRTGTGLGEGDIIVVTQSGGIGSSLVKFRGFMPRVGLLTESCVWVDESKLFEEKTTGGMSMSRPYSPMLNDDPLGVAPEETGVVLPADKIEEMYPKTSGSTLSEDFNPSRFLLEKHLDTSFDSLKSGYYHLESQDTRKTRGPSSFIRSNLGTILQSLDTLENVQEQLLKDESSSPGGSICEEMKVVLKDCNTASNALFKDLLNRKDDADAKRNALGVLQRFRFLFSLQRNIDKNIQQGDYEIVISDYNRAKALFQNTDVKSFQKALREVDHKISQFVDQLKAKLMSTVGSTLDDQKRLIRYLNELDYPDDAAWECLQNQQLWIKSMLQTSKEIHLDNESRQSNYMTPPTSSLELRVARGDNPTRDFVHHKRTPSDGGKQPGKRKIYSRVAALPAMLARLPSFSGVSDQSQPDRVLFLDELLEIMTENLPDMWNLSQAYVSGQLSKKGALASSAFKRNAMEQKENALLDMMCDVVNSFSCLIRGVLFPDSLPSELEKDELQKYTGWSIYHVSLVPWLPDCVCNMRKCLESLKSHGIIDDVLFDLQQTTRDIFEYCVKEVLQAAVHDISNLSVKETFDLAFTEDNACISQLPGLFERMVSDSFTFVTEFLADSQLDNPDAEDYIREDLIDQMKAMFVTFIDCMDAVAFIPEPKTQENMDLSGSQYVFEQSNHQINKLLVVLSNVNYLEKDILPKLIDNFIDDSLPESKANMVNEIVARLHELDTKVFDAFIEERGDPLVGGIEQGMTLSGITWDTEDTLIAVRSYLRELVMNLVVIHYEVTAISYNFVPRVFERLVDLLSDELKRLIECSVSFSSSGAMLATLELDVIQSTLSVFLTEHSRKSLNASLLIIPDLKDDDFKTVKDASEQFEKEMLYQVSCFGTQSNDFDVTKLPKEPANLREERPPPKGAAKVVKKKRRAPNVPNQASKLISNRSLSKLPPAQPVATTTTKRQNSTKRKAPPAPTQPSLMELSQSNKPKDARPVSPNSNPFLSGDEDDADNNGDNNNPFLEDSNPFLEDSNPFLDESNPFLDNDDDEEPF